MILIRRTSPEDAEQLTHITVVSKRHWNYPEKWIQLWLPILTISPEYISVNEVWMAVENEKTIGYYSFKHSDECLWLDNLWVLPEHMGQGIGRMLFQHALERYRAQGVSTLKIEADPNAQNFTKRWARRKSASINTNWMASCERRLLWRLIYEFNIL